MEKKTLGLIIGISALSVVGGALTIYHCCIKKKPDEGHSPFYPGTPTPALGTKVLRASGLEARWRDSANPNPWSSSE
ncbi:hypothetical protein BKA59DRAFT_512352 [Fusarium tricinctum]|uniref:Uncharacterized protein n=1 Tax=Fusarium tricinctum TaxID=61284 RepID=A0A8K0RX46_9HYPO|nr:hypothetical protein BKA59DRAFT_512352 [Fusarium tricinctum]